MSLPDDTAVDAADMRRGQLVESVATAGEEAAGVDGTGASGLGDSAPFAGEPTPVLDCATNRGGCEPNQVCSNQDGTISCIACPEGSMAGTAGGCEVVDACLAAPCDALTECSSTPDGFECSDCPIGFSGDGYSGCLDIDECATGTSCAANERCVNLAGAHRCEPCQAGDDCLQVALCADEHGGCDPLVTCDDSPVGPVCGACPVGFTGDGQQGCLPTIIALTVASSGLQLEPAFEATVTEYVGSSPSTAAPALVLDIDHPLDTELLVDGVPQTAGLSAVGQLRSVLTRGLSAGTQVLALEVRSSNGAQREYRLSVTRSSQIELVGYLKAPRSTPFAEFGATLAVAGDLWVVGAPGEGAVGADQVVARNAGAVYLFRGRGGRLRLEARLSLPTPAAGIGPSFEGARFGSAIAVDDTRVVVGAPGYGGEGRVYIFEEDAEVGWRLVRELGPGFANAGSGFGTSLALNFPQLLVGAPNVMPQGAAYFFEWPAGIAEPQGRALSFGAQEASGEAFGRFVGCSDTRLLVGGEHSMVTFEQQGGGLTRDASALTPAPRSGLFVDDGLLLGFGFGAQQYLRVDGLRWTSASRQLTLSQRATADGYGSAMALERDTGIWVVGAPQDDTEGSVAPTVDAAGSAPNMGAAYVTAFAAPVMATYLRATNAGAYDAFGASVAVSAHDIAIGAPGESGESSGLRSDSLDSTLADQDLSPGSGAVYLFR